ncbi:MAG: hypothetical protein ACTSQ8_26350 [Candidatus Helarchaeota archaeon]
MSKMIAATNWIMLIFGGAAVVSWIGGTVTVKNYESNAYSWYESLFYIAFTVFALAVFVRFILFCITGG